MRDGLDVGGRDVCALRLRRLLRRPALLLPALLWLGAIACGGPDPQASAPNLVYVIADDQHYRDFGFMGSPVARTPNLDRLAEEGTVFRNGYSTGSLCRPALRTLLTGLEPLQYGARERQLWAEYRQRQIRATPDLMIERFETLPRVLGRLGWRSFQSGKHWEGSFKGAGFSHGMTLADMDQGTRIVRETLEPLTDFLDRTGDEPFFLWFAPMLPHWPHDAPERFRALYADAGLTPAQIGYYAGISWLDQGVGRLLGELDARGLRERTLVVFVVDNGWEPLPDVGWRDGPHGKGTLYDAGWHTPIILRWPGRIPAGAVHDALVSFVDLAPTVYGYLGVPAPPGLPGHDLRPLIEGRADSVRQAVFGHLPKVRQKTPDGRLLPEGPAPLSGMMMRTRRWYYIAYSDDSERLYRMDVDPEQEHDVSARHPALAHRMRERLRRWLERL